MSDLLREIYHSVADYFGIVSGQRDPLIPPQRFILRKADGSRDVREFVWIGEGIAQDLIRIGLKPHHKVLEVGCGIGRNAIPLAKYLNEGGSYRGIDIVPDNIRWCSSSIAKTFSNATFQLIDVYNKHYNPVGRHKACEVRLPYEESEFDFVVLMSVFTHMLPNDMEHYLSEIRRLLSPKGRCVMTFFLLNDEARKYMTVGGSDKKYGFGVLRFHHEYAPGCRVSNSEVPERVVAYEESLVKDLCQKNGLNVESIRYGSWCGRQEHDGYQDCIVTTKMWNL